MRDIPNGGFNAIKPFSAITILLISQASATAIANVKNKKERAL
jgi:hypothetical protein